MTAVFFVIAHSSFARGVLLRLFSKFFMMDVVVICNRVQYLPATREPLSADVIAVRGDRAWWIFDVGMSAAAADFVNGLQGVSATGEPLKKNIVISHFHRDHLLNLQRAVAGEIHMPFDGLFVGPQSFKYTRQGTVVTEPLVFEDGVRIRIMPIPSSHAKGSLVMTVDDEIAFLGDATYPTVGHGAPDTYNVQLLQEEIRYLQELDVKSFALSHRKCLVQTKDSVVQFLQAVYAKRPEKGCFIVF